VLRLLIVEDEAFGQEAAGWFQLEGWASDLAQSPEIAKTKLKNSLRIDSRIDAVILDRKFGLVEDKGDRLLRWIRERREFDYVCVLMLTAFGSASSATECIRLGADRYIEKPLLVDDLRDVVIAGILGRRTRELRHSAVFGNSTAQELEKDIQGILLAVTGDQEMTIYVIEKGGAVRKLGVPGESVLSNGPRPFLQTVLNSRRPFAALTAAGARKAGAFRTDARALIAVPIPSSNGQPLGVWAVESSRPGILKGYMVDPIEEFGQVLGLAAELAEKRTLLEERASKAVLALREIRHRLSTPVQAIEWKVEELRDQGLPALTQEPIAAIRRNISTIRDLCYQLNDESSDIPVKKNEFDIREFLEEYTEEFRSEAESKNISLNCEGLPKCLLEVWADRRWLGYCLQCLLRNAIDAIDAKRALAPPAYGGELRSAEEIRLSVSVSDKDPVQVSISVEDTGSGIAEKDRERVFQPLFSTKLERSHDFGGLGLYSVQRILLQHDGSASFDSTPGKGATFRLTFPAQ